MSPRRTGDETARQLVAVEKPEEFLVHAGVVELGVPHPDPVNRDPPDVLGQVDGGFNPLGRTHGAVDVELAPPDIRLGVPDEHGTSLPGRSDSPECLGLSGYGNDDDGSG